MYAACESCDSLVVRHDVNVDLIGKVAELQPDGSPLQIGTHGIYNGVPFEIAGRIQITYGDGYWNEWYLLYENGQTGWLGESMGEYFVSFQREVQGGLPGYHQLQVGQSIAIDGEEFGVTGLMTSRVVSFEGELPFIMQQDYDLPAADLRSASGKAATLDFSEEQPILFLGEYLDFDDLEFQGCRLEGDYDDDGPRGDSAKVRKLDCTSCGAPQEIKGGIRSQTLVCEYCDAALDLTNPDFAIIWKAEEQRAHKIEPTVEIGSKAEFDGVEWEVIGFMRKSVAYSGIVYPWTEYLLHNYFHGYRWMTESDGHFNLMKTLHKLPTHQHGRPAANPTQYELTYEGEKYSHFQSSRAKVDYVAGEFYWRVQLGQVVENHDYVEAPKLLSLEVGPRGNTWTQGIYLPASEVVKRFQVDKSKVIYASGVAPNQINPYKDTRKTVWKTLKSTVAVAFVMMLALTFTGSKTLLTKSEKFMKYDKDRTRTSKSFKISSTSNVKAYISTDLYSRWAFFDMALVDQKTKKAYRFGKTVEYWGGGDGSRKGKVLVSTIPPGEYVLFWTVQTGKGYTADEDKPQPPGKKNKKLFSYTIKLQHKVPMWGWFFFLLFCLIWVPCYYTMRYNSFESRRWAQSDHAA